MCRRAVWFFLSLLGKAETGSFFGLPSDLFLRLDPLVGTAIPLVTRTLIPALFPAVFTILLAVLAGRIFCGWLCPMGATLDIFGGAVRRLLGRGKSGKRHVSAPVPRSLKYLVLAVILTAALCGVNLAFWASPIPLTTRLYGLVLHPLGLEGIGQGLEAVSPLLERAGAIDWLYWHPDTRYFYTSCFVGAFWFVLIVLESAKPRFWCRCLCPAGALLGLFSRFAFWKRHVSTNCASCGRCSAQCPAGILKENPALSQPSECLTCQTCVSACSHKAVSFGFGNSPSAFSSPHHPMLPARRAFCASLAAGAALAGISHADALWPSTASGRSGQATRQPPGNGLSKPLSALWGMHESLSHRRLAADLVSGRFSGCSHHFLTLVPARADRTARPAGPFVRRRPYTPCRWKKRNGPKQVPPSLTGKPALPGRKTGAAWCARKTALTARWMSLCRKDIESRCRLFMKNAATDAGSVKSTAPNLLRPLWLSLWARCA